MKKTLIAASAAVLTSALISSCGSGEAEESTCGPMALQSISQPLPDRGGGGGGGGGRGGGGGGGKGGSSSGGSKSGGGGSGGGSKPGSGTSTGKPASPKSPQPPSAGSRLPQKPNRGYHSTPGQPAPTYVRQSNGMWMPFIGGLIVGDMLATPPEGCDDD